jgi:hypothetical protein
MGFLKVILCDSIRPAVRASDSRGVGRRADVEVFDFDNGWSSVRISCLDLCDFVARDGEILDKNVGNNRVL